MPAACHIVEQYANNPIESGHGRLKARLLPMRGLKRLRSTRVTSAGHAFVQNLRRGRYELGVDVGPAATAPGSLHRTRACHLITTPPRLNLPTGGQCNTAPVTCSWISRTLSCFCSGPRALCRAGCVSVEVVHPARSASPLGASSVDAAHNDGDGLDTRRAHGWHGGARVVPKRNRFVIHADRATFGMITFLIVRLWLCRADFGGPRFRPRGHRGP